MPEFDTPLENIKCLFLNKIILADKRFITFLLNRICKDSGLQISTPKTKVIPFRGTDPVRVKIVIDGTVLELSLIHI